MRSLPILCFVLRLLGCSTPTPPPTARDSGVTQIFGVRPPLPGGERATPQPNRKSRAQTRKPLTTAPDKRSPAEISQAACRGRDGKWRCPAIKPTLAAAGNPVQPIAPASWSVDRWYVDPLNSLGCASDQNNCTSIVCGGAGSGVGPCLTYAEINVHRWGCFGTPSVCPNWPNGQNTTVQFLSSHPNDSDPLYISPGITGTALTIRGTLPAPVATVSLSGVVAKNGATSTKLQANLGASAVFGMFLVNNTRNSRAWVYTALGGNVFDITQPLLSGTVGVTNANNAVEDNTWANTDSVSMYNLTNVNIVYVSPKAQDESGILNLYLLNVFSPDDVGNDSILIENNSSDIVSLECSFSRFVQSSGLNWANAVGLGGSFINLGGFASGGGFLTGPFSDTFSSNFGSFGGDFIFGNPTEVSGPGEVQLGNVWADDDFIVYSTDLRNVGTYVGGTAATRLDLRTGGDFSIEIGQTFTGVLTAPGIVTNGVQLDRGILGFAYSPFGTISMGTSLANLDAPVGGGGFGLTAYSTGGSSVFVHSSAIPGLLYTVTPIAVTGGTVTLTAAQFQNALLTLTGTLSSDLVIQFPALGAHSSVPVFEWQIDVSGLTLSGHSLTYKINGGAAAPAISTIAANSFIHKVIVINTAITVNL
jgi:hypothetical protein